MDYATHYKLEKPISVRTYVRIVQAAETIRERYGSSIDLTLRQSESLSTEISCFDLLGLIQSTVGRNTVSKIEIMARGSSEEAVLRDCTQRISSVFRE